MKHTLHILLVFLAAAGSSVAESKDHPGAAITADTVALLCADQADKRVRLIDPTAPGDRKPTLWCYPEENGKPFKYMPTDTKRVLFRGVVHILAAYHGRVRLVRFADKKLIKDFPSYSSCHSAELLPDGNIVTANSNHGKLRVHHTTDHFTDINLPYAHGVVWDKKRHRLWALGDFLYRLRYTHGKLAVEKKFKLPISPTGHDLFPLHTGSKLLVSNNDALFLFDPSTGAFEKISALREIKSASQHRDGSLWASDPTDLDKAAKWQSNAVIRVQPNKPHARYLSQGARFYKARWWQDVPFSY